MSHTSIQNPVCCTSIQNTVSHTSLQNPVCRISIQNAVSHTSTKHSKPHLFETQCLNQRASLLNASPNQPNACLHDQHTSLQNKSPKTTIPQQIHCSTYADFFTELQLFIVKNTSSCILWIKAVITNRYVD